MTEDNPTAPITASLVSNETDRLKVLPALFGSRHMRGEALVYAVTRRFSSDYEGGHWNYYTLSNGGYYLAPDLGDMKLNFRVPTNGFEGELSPDATGIVSTLFALGDLMQEVELEPEFKLLMENHYSLKIFAGEHPEYKGIFAAID